MKMGGSGTVMDSRHAMRRDIAMAWDGWPIPEMLGGAVVGALLGLSIVTVVPQLAAIVPNTAGLVAGAVVGAALSYVWRPRRFVVERRIPEAERSRHARAA